MFAIHNARHRSIRSHLGGCFGHWEGNTPSHGFSVMWGVRHRDLKFSDQFPGEKISFWELTEEGGRWLSKLLVTRRGYFRPSLGLGSKHRAGIIAIVYFLGSIYNRQYPKDSETRISPIRDEYNIIFTSFLK